MKKKILHFGNIANNAYLNSKFLRSQQYLSDVISLNYKHIMGQPEWEDAEIISHGDDFAPNFLLYNSFKKPNWFYDGSIKDIINKFKKEQKLQTSSVKAFLLEKFFYKFHYLFFFLIFKTFYFFFIIKCRKNLKNLIYLHKYHIDSVLLERVFKLYDHIIFYGTTSIYGYLSGVTYSCYEHGSIRDFPYQNSLFGKLVFKSYASCQNLFITNCDAIHDAKKIKVKKFDFIPHPVNENLPNKNNKKENIQKIIESLKSKDCIKIFHPSRQHWSKDKRDPNLDKGNDVLWEGLFKLNQTGKDFYCIAVDWGAHLEESKKLINYYNINHKIEFIQPLCHFDFIRLLDHIDIVADQFFLGSFGSLAPKALMAGVPVLINYNKLNHDWAFFKHPPFINCKNSDDIYSFLSKTNQQELEVLKKESKNWYFNNHDSKVIINKFKKIISI